jgi:hypothetical protein
MCGRFTLTATPAALNDLFPLFDNVDLVPHYNVAPTQSVLAVRLRQGTRSRKPSGCVGGWCLVGPTTPTLGHGIPGAGSVLLVQDNAVQNWTGISRRWERAATGPAPGIHATTVIVPKAIVELPPMSCSASMSVMVTVTV